VSDGSFDQARLGLERPQKASGSKTEEYYMTRGGVGEQAFHDGHLEFAAKIPPIVFSSISYTDRGY
jgi:hypothetical protein